MPSESAIRHPLFTGSRNATWKQIWQLKKQKPPQFFILQCQWYIRTPESPLGGRIQNSQNSQNFIRMILANFYPEIGSALRFGQFLSRTWIWRITGYLKVVKIQISNYSSFSGIFCLPTSTLMARETFSLLSFITLNNCQSPNDILRPSSLTSITSCGCMIYCPEDIRNIRKMSEKLLV